MAEAAPAGGGGPLGPVLPGQHGHLAVRGGIAGIRFQLEELAAGARELEAVATALTRVEVLAHQVWKELCRYQNDSRSSGTQALSDTWEGRRAVGVVREELQDIGREVRACQRDYEAAEAKRLNVRLEPGSLGLLPALVADAGLTGFMNRNSTETLAANLPLALGLLLGVRPDMAVAAAALAAGSGLRGSRVQAIVRMMADQGVPSLKPRPVTAVQQMSSDIELDASPSGLLARARAVDAEGHGRIEVIRTITDDGRRVFIVVIPGTQPGDPTGGHNPFDEAGIAEGLGYRSKYTGGAILAALRQAQAEAGDQVVAVGYSQGGVHAMNLSQDKAFLAEYDLKYVLTAGAPVGGITPQPGISSLHLEHRQDWVPGSDGIPNADTKDRVTVTLSNRVLTPPGEDAGLGPGHRLTNYEAGAKAVAASDDPSLLASTATLAGVAGSGGAATATRFHMVRTTPAPPPKRYLLGVNPGFQADVRSPETRIVETRTMDGRQARKMER